MPGGSVLEDALRRMEQVLGRVESAVDRRLDHADRVSDLENELHRLGNDRSRLAQALDASEARAGRVAEANHDVSRRLVAAMESIRGVLDRHGG
ncbi:MAG: DUF4164 domain-containing protein [Bauldia sp.]|nr:DUF4164 domain-containing protein [Bauldia sp.]